MVEKLEDLTKGVVAYHRPRTKRAIAEEQQGHLRGLYEFSEAHFKQYFGATDDDHAAILGPADIDDEEKKEHHARQWAHRISAYGLEQILGKGHSAAYFNVKDTKKPAKHPKPKDGKEPPTIGELELKGDAEEMLDDFLRRQIGIGYDELVDALKGQSLSDFDNERSIIGQIVSRYSSNLVSHERAYRRADKKLDLQRTPEYRPQLIQYLDKNVLAGLDKQINAEKIGNNELKQLLQLWSSGGKRAVEEFIRQQKASFKDKPKAKK